MCPALEYLKDSETKNKSQKIVEIHPTSLFKISRDAIKRTKKRIEFQKDESKKGFNRPC